MQSSVFGDSAGWGAEAAWLAALVEAVHEAAAEESGAAQDHAAGVLGAWPGLVCGAVTIFVGGHSPASVGRRRGVAEASVLVVPGF